MAFDVSLDQRTGLRAALLVPPAHGRIPEEAALLCPPGVSLEAVGLGLVSLTKQAYQEGAAKALEAASRLRDRSFDALSLMGTSLSFFAGREFEEELRSQLSQKAGCPATTMAAGVLRAMFLLGISRPAIVTAYARPVNDALVDFLASYGLEPGEPLGLGIEDVVAVESVTTSVIVDTAMQSLSKTPGANGVLISCGGMKTLASVAEIERHTGLPVVSSSLAGPWDLLGLLGHSPAHAFNSLLLRTPWKDVLQPPAASS